MKRIKSLNRYQKMILIFISAITLLFSIIYYITVNRAGFEYYGSILVPRHENGSVIYEGTIDGVKACFTVSPDKIVTFKYSDKTWGPYIVREDDAAAPKNIELKRSLKGIEISCKDVIIFRGGMLDNGGNIWLYDQDGNLESSGFSASVNVGGTIHETIDMPNTLKPSVFTILYLVGGPKLSHKGDLNAWLYGAFICAMTAVSILFADELFRFSLSFSIRDPERAEPSDWEIASRYIVWTIMPIAALISFIAGLG